MDTNLLRQFKQRLATGIARRLFKNTAGAVKGAWAYFGQ